MTAEAQEPRPSSVGAPGATGVSAALLAGLGFVLFTNNNVGDELAHAFEQFLIFGRDTK